MDGRSLIILQRGVKVSRMFQFDWLTEQRQMCKGREKFDRLNVN